MNRTLPWPVLLPVLLPCVSVPLATSAAALQSPNGAARVAVSLPRLSRSVVFTGKPVDLSVEVSNPGSVPLRGLSIDLITPPELLLDPPAAAPNTLASGAATTRRWVLTADKAGVYPASVRVRAEGVPEQTTALSLVVTRAPADLDTRSDLHPQVKPDRAGNLVFRNAYLVAVVMKNEGGYGPVLFYPATRPAEPPSAPVAVAPVLGSLSWKEGEADHSGTFLPGTSRISGDNHLLLSGTVRDGGVSWATEAELTLNRDPWLSWEVRTRPSGAAGLTRFAPMSLRVGHGGEREALFPGLEYLEGTARSASAGGAHARLVPDPYRITVPVMVHSQDGGTVALMWNQNQAWGGPGHPAALFDAPNRAEGQSNTRMELFLPSVPRFVRENAETAAEPFHIAANQLLRLSGKVLVERDNANPASAVRRWVDAFGKPATSGWVRNPDQERALSREAYTRTGWDAAAREWRGETAGAPGRNDPLAELALIMDAARTSSPAVRTPLRAQVNSVLDDFRKQGALDPRLAYRTGGVLRSLDAERDRALELVRIQLASGAWPWIPASTDQANLGTPGDIEVGTVTAAALPILRYAAQTGDSTAAGSGRKALEFLDAHFRVPRGAQSNHVPLRVPDLLAATEAAECFLLGYQVSGETRYMEAARYWANTGLPFVYFWSETGHPVMNHATLATFGADSPAAAPAQWCGLAYAHVLQALSQVRSDSLYDSVAQGILQSAMRQQYPSGDSAGLLPENWDLRENRGAGAKLLPDRLVAVLDRYQDLDTDVSHVRLRVGPDRMFVATGAHLRDAETSAFRMWLDLHWIKGEDTFTTVMGVPSRPISVQYNSTSLIVPGVIKERHFLPESESESNEGWYYDAEGQYLILRVRHTGDTDHLEIRWPDPRERQPVHREDRHVNPRR